jgi:hypothetical protein
MVNCHCDSTIAMPILITALSEQTELLANRKPPKYDMGPLLQIQLQSR